MALSPRTAITFAPGVPPIATTLTRYYEAQPGRVSALKRLGKTAAMSVALFIAFGVLGLALSGLGAPQQQPMYVGESVDWTARKECAP